MIGMLTLQFKLIKLIRSIDNYVYFYFFNKKYDIFKKHQMLKLYSINSNNGFICMIKKSYYQ